jgi:hypothetical protein
MRRERLRVNIRIWCQLKKVFVWEKHRVYVGTPRFEPVTVK